MKKNIFKDTSNMKILKLAIVSSIIAIALITILIYLFSIESQQTELEPKKTEVAPQKNAAVIQQSEIEKEQLTVEPEQVEVDPKKTNVVQNVTSDTDLIFNIEQRTDNEINGYFNYESSQVIFHGFMETPLYARAQVRVNDIIFDASSDLNENTKVIDGHGMALSENDRLALQALSMKFEIFLKPYEQKMPEYEDLLFRMTLYLSEAPVGMPITRLEANPPQNP